MEQVSFTGSSGTVYQLDFGTNAKCRLEEAIGADLTFDDVVVELRSARPHVTRVRQYVKASLIEPNGETLTLEQVGDIIDDLGGFEFVLVGLDSQSPSAKASSETMALAARTTIQRILRELAAADPASTDVVPADDPVTH